MTEACTIVVCDDEELIRWSLCEHLNSEGHRTIPAADGMAALDAVKEHAPRLVLLDLKMPRMDGLTTLRKLRESGSDVPVIVITAHSAVDSAIEATRLGASAYLSKPFDLREVSLEVARTLEQDRLRQEVHRLRHRHREGYGEFIGQAPSLDPVYDTLRRLEEVDPPTVLITGESGTGKDVLARAIHSKGPRADRVFMEVDCASLPEQLIESELFGHERGAFTDARNTKRGLFEVAGGGVVFLDEIGEMTLATQAKLLRALENRRFKRVGGVAPISLAATVIAATNRDLRTEVDAGRFREDLFFRLNIIPIQLPPLRDRASDVKQLAELFIAKFNRNFGRRLEGVSGEAMTMLEAYRWPGNVRELRNVLERAVLLTQNNIIEVGDLPPEIRFARPQQAGCPFTLPAEGVDLEAVERGLLVQALERTAGNQSAAARLLRISRYTLRYRMEKYELSTAG
jgi:DNA-binding NtrC family response regulator